MKICENNTPLKTVVCGFERGGTTLLSEILKQHPMLASGFEGGFLLVDEVSEFLKLEPYCTNFKRGWQIEDNDLDYICQAHTWANVYQRVIERSPVIENKETLIFDKTPKYMQDLPNVLKKVPNVSCIVLIRDPRAVLYSWAKRSQLDMEEWLSKNLKSACTRYVSYLKGYTESASTSLNSRILLIRYEEICLNQQQEAEKIFDFLKFDFDPSFISFQKNKSFPNVHGNQISGSYLLEYESGFPKWACEKILEFTKNFNELCWFSSSLK